MDTKTDNSNQNAPEASLEKDPTVEQSTVDTSANVADAAAEAVVETFTSDEQLVALFGVPVGEMLIACEPTDLAADYVESEVAAGFALFFYTEDHQKHTVEEVRFAVNEAFTHPHLTGVVESPIIPLIVDEVASITEAPHDLIAPEIAEAVYEAATVVEPEPEPTDESSAALTLERLREIYAGQIPADAMLAWDRTTLMSYHLTRDQPTKTARGNWPVDVRRAQGPEIWGGSELDDWLDGIIPTPKGVDEELIHDEIYKRYRIPNNWTYAATKTYLKSNVSPEYTEHGVLVDDRMRDLKPVAHWTHLELRSALLGQINSPHSKEDLVASIKSRLGLSDNFSASRLLETLAQTSTESSMDNTLLKSKLDEYKLTMSKYGKNLTDVSAGKAQVMLYKAIRKVMARDSIGFSEGWTIILDFINVNYQLLFLPDIARRGYSQLDLSKNAALTFEDLMTLLIHTRAPNTRSREAKLYKLDQILRYVPVEEERANVIHFYAQ